MVELLPPASNPPNGGASMLAMELPQFASESSEGCGFSDRGVHGDCCWIVGSSVASRTAASPGVEFVP